MSISHAVSALRPQVASAGEKLSPSPIIPAAKKAAEKASEVAKDALALTLFSPIGAAACISCPTVDLWNKMTRDNPGPTLVDKTMETGNLKKFSAMANELTKGELEETADYIVKTMATEPNADCRKLLQKMHTVIRAEQKSREWNWDFKWPKDFDPKWILA